jgi:hypothetical protein
MVMVFRYARFCAIPAAVPGRRGDQVHDAVAPRREHAVARVANGGERRRETDLDDGGAAGGDGFHSAAEGRGVLGEHGCGDEAAAEGVQAGVGGRELAVEGGAEVGVGGGGCCVGDAQDLQLGGQWRDCSVYLGGGEFGAKKGPSWK